MSDDETSKLCRLCLAVAQVGCHIFSKESSENDADLPTRIMSCAQIKVTEGDGLPATICHQCLVQVDLSYQFRLLCENSDATLRESLVQEKMEKGLEAESSEEDAGKGSPRMNGLHVNGRAASTDKSDDEAEAEMRSSESEGEGDEEEGPGVNGEGAADSESVDGWEVMKFTPEVIISEEDSKGSGDGVENGSLMARNMNSLVEQQLYQLSQVEAILRNHGTEIKVQGANQMASAQQKRALPAVGNATPGSQGQERWQDADPSGNYFPMYGVEAVLTPSAARPTPDESGPPHVKSRRPSHGSGGGEKLFKCRLCPKSYSFSSALSRHKAVHNTMLRPYVCLVCKKGFAEPDKLERHSRTHLVDRTWRCNNCGRLFKALNTYERHVTTICSYRNKENGGVAPAAGLSTTPQQTVVYFNS